jgi:hypothetical protein
MATRNLGNFMVVSNRNSVTNMDEFFAAGLRAEFESAVEHVGTSGMSISESDQRTLFGLYVAPLRLPACVHPALACSGEVSIRYQVAKYGPAGSSTSVADSEEARLQFEAWRDVGPISQTEAMTMYCDLVALRDPSFDPDKEQADQDSPRPVQKPVSSACASDLFDAARCGDTIAAARYLEALVHSSGSLDRADTDGLTALMYAVDGGHVNIVRSLVSASANVNCTDPTGSTALHYAALLGNSTVSQILVEAGANVNAKDEDGKTPAQIASAEGYDALAHMLQ